MPLKGHVYRITDPGLAFVPVITGSGPPADGYEPWPNATVVPMFWAPQPWDASQLLPLPWAPVTTAADGAFTIDVPSLDGLPLKDVSLTVSSGVTVYRSTRVSVDEAKSKHLDFWIFHDKLPASDGVTAGDVSSIVNGSGLPANTSITAGPGGLEFVGSQSQVSMDFGIRVVPDRTFDLTTMLDIELHTWQIDVGWPASMAVSAGAVLNLIKAGLNGAEGGMNAALLVKMEKILSDQEPISPAAAATFLTEKVSVTFANVAYPKFHTWGIDHVHDETIVITADPCIGYPRHISAEKSH